MASVQLDGPRLPAASGTTDSLVMLVHGYGADGNDLIGLAPYWQQFLPNTAFVAPHAPERCDMNPMGYQWFGIKPGDYEGMKAGVQNASECLNAFIDSELAANGLDESRLVMVGFSQGTMMSLQVALRREKQVAGIIGYSGRLVDAAALKDEITVHPPVLLVHGDMDEMIPADSLFEATQGLLDAGVTAEWHISQGVGHSIAPDGLDLGGKFLKKHLLGQ